MSGEILVALICHRLQNIAYNNITMGSTSPPQWKPPADLYIVLNYKYCRVWVKKEDRIQHFEEYALRVNSQIQLEQYQKMFVLRLKQPYFPVNLCFMNDPNGLLCGNLKAGSILIQRIPYRLCQFINIFYQEGVSILFFCFRAYQMLHHHYGIFNVKSTMICLDLSYRVKVWHHTDLSSPYPEDPYCHTVFQMINTIIKAIEKVSACPYDIPRFSEYLQIKKIDLYGFELALKTIQEYANQHFIKIQNKLQNIEKYLKQAEGILPISRKFVSMKSSERLPFTSEKGRNRSLNKFSFKDNKIIEVSALETSRNISNNVYFNTSRNNSSSKPGKVEPFQKVTQPIKTKSSISSQEKIQQPIAANEKRDINYNFSEYGLEKAPRHGSLFPYNREMPKLQMQKQDNRFWPTNFHLTHGRTVSDFPRASKQVGVKPSSPYDDMNNTETKSGEGSHSRSLKTLISADSYSFSVDDEMRNEMTNMLKPKKKW